MEPVIRFFARHPVMYVVALAGAAVFGAFALVRTFREETAAGRARDLGLTAIAAAEVGGMVALRPKIQKEQMLLEEFEEEFEDAEILAV